MFEVELNTVYKNPFGETVTLILLCRFIYIIRKKCIYNLSPDTHSHLLKPLVHQFSVVVLCISSSFISRFASCIL